MLIHVVKVFKLKINQMSKLYISVKFVLFITLFFFDFFLNSRGLGLHPLYLPFGSINACLCTHPL